MNPGQKKPKICARDLDRINNPEQNKRKSLAGEELHKYLVENCARIGFVLPPVEPVHGNHTVADMISRLVVQWKVGKRHGRTALCAYADFGKSMRLVYGLYKIEQDCGDRTDTWAEWLKQ